MAITNILAGKALPVYGDGMQVRDWLHVDDHNTGIAMVIGDGRDGATYNIGGDNERPNLDIFRLVCTIVDQRFEKDASLAERFPDAPPARNARSEELMENVADRPGHDRRYAIDASKIRTELGYMPLISFERGMNLTVDWYLENEQWWRNVMDGSYREWIRKNYEQR